MMGFRWFRVLVQLGIGAVILLWLLQLADISKVSSTLLTVNPLNIVLASIFFIIASTFVALALYVSLKSSSPHIPARKVVMASFAGQLLSDVTPVRSGYFATPLILNRLCGISVEKGMVGVLTTGIVNSFVKVVLAGIAVAYFVRFLPLHPALINALVVGILFLLVGGLILLALMLEKRVLKLKVIFEKLPLVRRVLLKLIEIFNRIQDEGQKVKGRFPHVALLILLSVVANATALYFICSALWSGSPSLIDFIFMVALASCLMYVPITIAGLGVQETGYILLLTLLGMHFESAVAFALLTRTLFTGTDAIGLYPLIRVGFRFEEEKAENGK